MINLIGNAIPKSLLFFFCMVRLNIKIAIYGQADKIRPCFETKINHSFSPKTPTNKYISMGLNTKSQIWKNILRILELCSFFPQDTCDTHKAVLKFSILEPIRNTLINEEL